MTTWPHRAVVLNAAELRGRSVNLNAAELRGRFVNLNAAELRGRFVNLNAAKLRGRIVNLNATRLRSRVVATCLVGLFALRPEALLAGSTEVRIKLPLRPKLAVAGREKIALAPFLVAHELSERKDATKYKDLDLDQEFRRYLGKQISKRSKMTVVPVPSDATLPVKDLRELGEAAAFWRDLGGRTGADILLSGLIDFKVEDRSGYRTEEYVSPLDGRTYYRQVLVEATGFYFDVTVQAFDGRTGAKLLQEEFKDRKEKSRRRADELVGLFENLFALESQLLGLFVVREREANRYIFD